MLCTEWNRDSKGPLRIPTYIMERTIATTLGIKGACSHCTLMCQSLVQHNVNIYRKVASSRLSRLVAHPSIFRLFMKGKFDAYVSTVTFVTKSSKLNSRPVYCSKLYSTLFYLNSSNAAETGKCL